MLKKSWIGFALLLFAVGLGLQADSYWQWGWGDYGSGLVEDVARFDWSFINYGNVPQDERTVQRCNAILKLNPKHRFVIRFWPIMSLGKLPENRYQGTLWDYFYRPEVKGLLQENIRKQFELLHNGLSNPKSIVGMTFLEELPGHFTSGPFKRPITQAFMPWDMAPFANEISTELGHPFDISKEKDALWWGKKYCQFLNEVHQYMRSLKPDCKILYWQATYYNTLDRSDKKLFAPGVLPFHLEDLLKDGNCDGIFGYPNSDQVWQKQTMDLVAKNKCLFFSQTSTPAFMRLTGFADTVERVLVKNPGNLGSFVFFGRDNNIHAWNMIPEFKGNNRVHISDLQRWFCHRYQVGLPVARRLLQPRLYLGYDFRDKAVGDYVTLSVALYNPRDKSWFGGAGDEVILKNVELHLAGIPDGYILPAESNSPRLLRFSDVDGGEVMEAIWWLQKERESDHFSPEQLQMEVKAAGLQKTVRRGEGMQQARNRNTDFTVTHAGERWLMLTGGSRESRFHLELEALYRPISYPKLTFNGQEILFRGVLEPGSKLLLHSGIQATLLEQALISEKTARFERADDAAERVFSEGYLVFSSPPFKAKAGRQYTFTITGFVAENAILNTIVEFTGKRDGRMHKESVGRYNPLRKERSTARLTVPTPAFDANSEIRAQIRFYRHNKIGKLHLQEFSFTDGEKLEHDVTQRLDGFLTLPANAILTAAYDDRDDVNFTQRPLLQLKLVDANEQKQAGDQRQGGADF